LLKFFKLDDNFSLEDLAKREYDIISELLSNKDPNLNSKYKFDIINFIKSGKEILKGIFKEIKTTKEINKNIEKKISDDLNKKRDPTVGHIITPLDTHQVLNTHINPPDTVDGYNYGKTTSVYVFNTAARNDFFKSVPSYSTFDLPLTWKNVISITLTAANIPNVMFAFNNDARTNQIYIKEDVTGKSGIVTLPEGNYVPYTFLGLLKVLPLEQASFPDSLTYEINHQLGTYNFDASGNPIPRFSVTFNPSNYTMTISNSTHTFSMHTIVKEPDDLCGSYSNSIFNDVSYNLKFTDKTKISTITYLQTMGYLMGYREIYYDASSSYTTESIFSNTYSNYLYFTLDDFTGSQTTSNTYGIVGPGLIAESVLGVIPLSSGIFKTTFDSNANFIYKKREYFGPVNVSRISIKLLNQQGNIVNLHNTDFSFALEVKTVYDLNSKAPIGFRGGSIF